YLPYYPPQANTGHGVALQGYRQGPYGREYVFQNSWGTQWGQNGFAWIQENMLRTHLLYAYRVRVSPASAPAPVQVSCPAGAAPVLGVGVPPATGLPSVPGVSWPSGVPTTMPSNPGLPSCPAGSVPNPLTGGCVAVPAPQ